MHKLGILTVAAITAGLWSTGAADAAELRYDYAELRYLRAEIDDAGADLDGDGFGIGGSLEIADNIHLFGSYQSLDFDFGIDTSVLELGAGYMVRVAPQSDLVARISYVDGEADGGGGLTADDAGLGLSAGFRRMFTPQLEGRAFINYVDLDDTGSDTSLELAGDYFFNDQFSAGLSLEFGDDETVFGLGGRYYFGRPVR